MGQVIGHADVAVARCMGKKTYCRQSPSQEFAMHQAWQAPGEVAFGFSGHADCCSSGRRACSSTSRRHLELTAHAGRHWVTELKLSSITETKKYSHCGDTARGACDVLPVDLVAGAGVFQPRFFNVTRPPAALRVNCCERASPSQPCLPLQARHKRKLPTRFNRYSLIHRIPKSPQSGACIGVHRGCLSCVQLLCSVPPQQGVAMVYNGPVQLTGTQNQAECSHNQRMPPQKPSLAMGSFEHPGSALGASPSSV